MARVLTDGKTKIGAYRFPNEKKVALCIENDNTIEVYGYFVNKDRANQFMEQLGGFVGAEMGK